MSADYQAALRRIAEARATEASILDLGDLVLHSLPKELGDLPALRVLALGQWAIRQNDGNVSWTYESDRPLQRFVDLNPLASLSGLKTLELAGCIGITDVRPISALTELQDLSLFDCINITHLKPLTFLTGLQSVRLGGWKLGDCVSIPDLNEIAYLSRLKLLGLRRCARITDLSPLTAMSGLQTLLLYKCPEIEDLAPLEYLHNLKRLDLTECIGIQDLSPLPALTSLQSLNLKGCTGIKDLGPLASLTNLQSLDLGGCEGVTDLSPLTSLADLRDLSLYGFSKITDLGFLAFLNDLKWLCLTGCTRIKDIGALASLTDLRWLSLNGKGITDLGALTCVTCLETLQLTDSDITDLRPLASLTALKSLDLFGCKAVTDLGPLTSLSALQALRLGTCWGIADLGPLASMTSLQSLDLVGCWGIADLGPLASLTALKSLDLNGCTEITDLGPLATLSGLKSLDLEDCRITDLRPLASLTALQSLNMRRCERITDLSPLASLTDLETLDLHYCSRLRAFSPLRDLTLRLRQLFLYGCCFEDVDAAICGEYDGDNVVTAVRAHYADLGQGESEASALKVFILGNGGVGKTQLFNRLQDHDFDPRLPSTHGVMRDDINIHLPGRARPIRLNVWDFGGQDIYHGSHTLFLQTPAVFLLMWTTDTENGEYMEGGLSFRHRPLVYWLDYIRCLAGTDNPVIVIQGKCDRKEDERAIPIALPEDFTSLSCLAFSAKVEEKVARFRCVLSEVVEESITRRPLPALGVGRARVRRSLLTLLRDDRHRPPEKRHRTLSQTAFQRLCDRYGPISDWEELLKFLHRTGVVFWRPDAFRGRIILDQSWALEGVYAIFHRVKVMPHLFGKGRFTRETLAGTVWHDRSAEDQQAILEMMESCGICFRSRLIDPKDPPAGWEYIVPELLPPRDSPEIERELVGGRIPNVPAGARAEIRYRFLHEGVLRRFLSWLGKHAADSAVYWKFGCWYYDPKSNQAVLVDSRREANPEHPGQGVITLEVWGHRPGQLLEWLVVELTKWGPAEKPDIDLEGVSELTTGGGGAWHDFFVVASDRTEVMFPGWLCALEMDTVDNLLVLAKIWKDWPTEDFNASRFAKALKQHGISLDRRQVLNLVHDLQMLCGRLIEKSKRGTINQRFSPDGRSRLNKAIISLQAALEWHCKRPRR